MNLPISSTESMDCGVGMDFIAR